MTSRRGEPDLDAQLAELRAWTRRVESDVADLAAQLQATQDELADARAQLASGGGAVGGGGVGPSEADVSKYAPLYATLDAWVEHWLVQVYRRSPTNTWRWCPQWHQHPEAVHRLEALHRTWETARHDPNGHAMLTWTRDTDHHLRELADPAGTFAACTPRDHRPNHPLPWAALAAPGAGMPSPQPLERRVDLSSCPGGACDASSCS